MKTIIIQDNGDISLEGGMPTDEERIGLATLLFDELSSDNDGQIIIYTGILNPDVAQIVEGVGQEETCNACGGKGILNAFNPRMRTIRTFDLFVRVLARTERRWRNSSSR